MKHKLQRLLGFLVFLFCLGLGLAQWQQYAPATVQASGWLGYWRFAGKRGAAYLGSNGAIFTQI